MRLFHNSFKNRRGTVLFVGVCVIGCVLLCMIALDAVLWYQTITARHQFENTGVGAPHTITAADIDDVIQLLDLRAQRFVALTSVSAPAPVTKPQK